MENFCEEFGNVKAEKEMLKAEGKIKTELLESSKEAYNDLLIQFQEANQHIGKQAQELNAKDEEISDLRQTNELLKSCLREKESSLSHLISVNKKLRADCEQKLQMSEVKSNELILALDESTTRNKKLEEKVHVSDSTIECLKRHLLTTENKLFEAEQRAQVAKELRQGEEIILKLEEENRIVHDELKWKKEQFKHLEEAHKRLQDLFQLSKEEWERGRSELVQEISSLQTGLQSQTRILEGLQSRLEMCNQALAHEESRRKSLEVEVSLFKSRFNDTFVRCQEEQSRLQSLTFQRDEDISKLRISLGTKELLVKEIEFKIIHLEKENREMAESLKEYQEAQIGNAGATSSLSKLRKKLKALEQVHRICPTSLKAKESEWGFQKQIFEHDLDRLNFELNSQTKQIEELHEELETCHDTIYVLNEEISLVLMVFKSEFSVAYSKVNNGGPETELSKYQNGNTSSTPEHLPIPKGSVNEFHLDLQKEQDKVAFLTERVQYLELMEHRQVVMEEQLQQYRKMLEESTQCQFHLKEQLLQMENAQNDYEAATDETLKMLKFQLAEKIHEVNQLECKLETCKSSTENLKVCYEECQEICKQIESSLVAKTRSEESLQNEKERVLGVVKEKDKRIDVMQNRIASVESTVIVKEAELKAISEEKEKLLQIANEKETCIEALQRDMTCLKKESTSKAEAAVLERLNVEKALEHLEEMLSTVVMGNDKSIIDLCSVVTSLELDLTNASISGFSEVIEKQIESDMLTEALEYSEHLRSLEIQEKNRIIRDLEKKVFGLCQKSACLEKSLLNSAKEAEQHQAVVEVKKSEHEKLMAEKKNLEGLVKELELQTTVLLQDSLESSTDRDDIFLHLEEFCQRIGEFSIEDVKLRETLEKILQSSDRDSGPVVDITMRSESYASTRENTEASLATKKRLEAGNENRSPLKEVNRW